MDKKLVGKKAEPTPDELEFIYSRIDRMSDRAILSEMQDESFAVRSVGFINRRRKEFLIAKRVLKAQLEKESDPIVIESKKRHFEDMANVAKDILDLLSMMKSRDDGKYEYEKRNVDGYTNTFVGSRKDLAKELHSNIYNAEKKHRAMKLFDRFLAHLSAETSALLKPDISELYKYSDSNPAELIDLLNILAKRKYFKGKCPVCESW